MAIIYNPITLPASKALSTLTTFLNYLRFTNTIEISNIVNDLVDSCRVGKVDSGKGIVFPFKVGLQPMKDLTKSSSAFTITEANVVEETITIDEYKFTPISYSTELLKDAVNTGEMVNTYLNFILTLPEETIQFHFFDLLNKMIQEWIPGQATQTIKVPQIDTTNLTGSDLTNANIWNSNNFAKIMRKTVNNMKIKNSKFTDIATYTDVNDNVAKPVVSALKNDNLKIIFNDKYYTDFLASSMASLYHSEKIGEMIPGDKFVLLPEDAMSTTNQNTIAWLSHKDKFALADFYKVTFGIQDPSTLYYNMFYHISYGTGIFKYAPGVKFVAEVITP